MSEYVPFQKSIYHTVVSTVFNYYSNTGVVFETIFKYHRKIRYLNSVKMLKNQYLVFVFLEYFLPNYVQVVQRL